MVYIVAYAIVIGILILIGVLVAKALKLNFVLIKLPHTRLAICLSIIFIILKYSKYGIDTALAHIDTIEDRLNFSGLGDRVLTSYTILVIILAGLITRFVDLIYTSIMMKAGNVSLLIPAVIIFAGGEFLIARYGNIMDFGTMPVLKYMPLGIMVTVLIRVFEIWVTCTIIGKWLTKCGKFPFVDKYFGIDTHPVLETIVNVLVWILYILVILLVLYTLFMEVSYTMNTWLAMKGLA